MEKSFKCELCSQKFDSFDMLNAHAERPHKRIRDKREKNFKCNVCGHESRDRHDLQRHTRGHTGERPFKCQVSDCEMAFTQESALKNHIKFKHSDERPLKCDFPDCLYTTKTTWNLKQHKKFHNDERPFSCPHSGCNFRAKWKHHLSRHTRLLHSESKTLKKEKIPCSLEDCEYKGKNSEALKNHMSRHKTLLPCPVSGCGRYAPTKEALEHHLKLHNFSGRAFQCPLCFKYYSKLDDLQRHCVVHTNEKPFQCGHCKYDAATRAQVKAHISSVHAATEFPFIVHLLDDRECLRCKVTLTSAEFVAHCKGHVEQVLTT